MFMLDASVFLNAHFEISFAIAFSVFAFLACAVVMRIARSRDKHAANIETKVFRFFIEMRGVVTNQKLVQQEDDENELILK